MKDYERPIGMFDSGVGGLSLLKEFYKILPNENVIYFADNARLPYGLKKEEEIKNYSYQIIDFLKSQGCKMIVIACNTASTVCHNSTLSDYGIPIVGVINYGCISAALYVTYNFKIGILSTEVTLKSALYRKEIDNFDPSTEVYWSAVTELVPLVESANIASPKTRETTQKCLNDILNNEVDTVILGCTHLYFVKDIIQDICTPAVTIIDPGKRTAILCRKRLIDNNILNKNESKRGKYNFYCSGDAESFQRTASILLQDNVKVDGVVNLG